MLEKCKDKSKQVSKNISLQKDERIFIRKVTQTDLDCLVGVSDESDEQAEHHVYEEGDEGVEVNSAEKPHHVAGLVPQM